MIYEYPDDSAAIRQGDIFIGLPRTDLGLQELPVVENGEVVVRTWRDVVVRGQAVQAVVGVRPVAAIVATQDCDTLRAPDVTLCEIRSFRDVERKSKETKVPKKWVDIITQQARINQKWFYLPPDARLGFTEKMGVDFLVTLRVPRTDLESYRYLRKGRLNAVADEHFRERIAEFFRRFPYDEWYALNTAELEAYRQNYPDAQPFPWQQVEAEHEIKLP